MVPALAIADVLSSRGYTVEFCGAGYGMEAQLVTRSAYPFHLIRIRGFQRHLGLSTLRTVASIPLAGIDAWRLLRRRRPACVVGVGAYASGPVVAEAALLGRPAVAVEMDAHLGWTNRILSRLVKRVCLSFPIPGREGGRFVYTGRPLRPQLLSATRTQGLTRFGLDPDVPVVLVFGGSLGAHTLNAAVVEAYAEQELPFQLLHVTGQREHAKVATAMRAEVIQGTGEDDAVAAPAARPNYQAFAYLDDFHLALAAADVVVGRAGGSVAELLARGLPSLLVPYPYATADHQMKNARALERAGAAAVVPDGELTGARLSGEVEKLLEPARREAMRRAALSLARPDATERIVREIVQLAGPPAAAPAEA